MERSQFMDGALCCFHSHGLIQTAIQGRAVITSLVEYALSLCGVTSRNTRRASRAPFPKLGLEQHPVALRIAFTNILAHCTFQLNPRTCIVQISTTLYVHTNIKRVLPAPLLETSTSVTSR